MHSIVHHMPLAVNMNLRYNYDKYANSLVSQRLEAIRMDLQHHLGGRHAYSF